jgi:hypothetical protein
MLRDGPDCPFTLSWPTFSAVVCISAKPASVDLIVRLHRWGLLKSEPANFHARAFGSQLKIRDKPLHSGVLV